MIARAAVAAVLFAASAAAAAQTVTVNHAMQKAQLKALSASNPAIADGRSAH